MFLSGASTALSLYRLALFLFAVWFSVGLGFLSLGAGPMLNHWEDFLFIAFAASVVFLESTLRLGFKRAFMPFLWIAFVSAVIETIGAKTGWPFGAYSYTGRFGPRLFETLPLAIPLAWYLIVWPFYLLSLHCCAQRGRTGLALRAILVGVLAVLVDVGLEPVATVHRQYWIWQADGFWYGVPSQNFAGWFLCAFLITIGLPAFLDLQAEADLRPAKALVVPHLLLLCVLISFLLVAGLHVGLPALLALALGTAIPAACLFGVLRRPGPGLWRLLVSPASRKD